MKNNLLKLSTLLMFPLLFTSCSDNGQVYDLKLEAQEEQSAKKITESFTASKEVITPPNVDISIYLDTSGSMRQEIESVRQNLESFLNKVAEYSNVQITVVANRDSTATTLSGSHTLSNQLTFNVPELDRVSQVDQFIYSNDGPVGTTTLLSDGRVSVRPSAKAIFLYVTDDNHRQSVTAVGSYTPQTFLNYSKSLLGQKDPTVYGIIGHRNVDVGGISDCNVTASTGNFYIDTAKASGGEVWSICEPQWSDIFDDLAGEIREVTTLSFALKKQPQTINSVTFDGQDLTIEEDYKIVGRTITVARELLESKDSGVLRVEYE